MCTAESQEQLNRELSASPSVCTPNALRALWPWEHESFPSSAVSGGSELLLVSTMFLLSRGGAVPGALFLLGSLRLTVCGWH